jgi:hypothetical protein
MTTRQATRLTTKTPRLWIGARLAPSSVAWLARERARTGESLGRVLDRAVLALSAARVAPQEVRHD